MMKSQAEHYHEGIVNQVRSEIQAGRQNRKLMKWWLIILFFLASNSGLFVIGLYMGQAH